MSIRLGIDASQSVASCAVSTDAGIVASAIIDRPIENFPALIRDVFTRADIFPRNIDEIVVCVGPGSQTGVRTAVVIGNALALALHKPVSGVLSTDAAAILAGEDEARTVAVSAGRRRWFAEDYRWQNGRLERLDQLRLVDDLPENAEPAFCGAEGADNDRSCAYGILMVAEQQRHLMAQAMLDEVKPYERQE